MEHADMKNKYTSLLTGTTRLRKILNCAVILILGLTVCTAHAVRPDGIRTLNNTGVKNNGIERGPVTEPTLQQLDAIEKGEKSGLKVAWNSRLGTPSSIRAINLGQKQAFSGGKGLSVKGGGAYKSDAVAVLDNISKLFRMKDAEKEVVVDRVDSDSLGFHHVRLKQTFEGLRVFGGDLIVHFNKEDLAYEVNGQYVPEINVKVEPDISADEALQIAQNELAELGLPAGELAKNPELVIYARNVAPALAYEFLLLQSDPDEEPAEWRFWINAVNGDVLLHYNNIQHIDDPSLAGTPSTAYGNILEGEGGAYTNVPAWFENDVYYLGSIPQRWVIMNAAETGYPDAGTYAHRDTDDWADSDPSEISAANNFNLIQKYYADTHGRNSFDDDGALAVANMHQGSNDGTEMVNAYWYPSRQQFYFGDGDGETANSLVVLDVSGHEFTHAVTENTAELIYSHESGAINESFSDIFGTCVEFKYQPDGRDSYPNITPGHADWLVGEDCWLSTIALRDLRNPSNIGTVGFNGRQASRYQGEFWYFGEGDYGGVHYNNSVQNFFFYLLCEGGSGNNEGIEYDLAGIGITNAEQIAYRTLSVYCTPSTDYKDARTAWLSAAFDLNPDWVVPVIKSWQAVGIDTPPPVMLSMPGALPSGREWADYSYGIGVTAAFGQRIWTIIDGNLPPGLSLDENSGVISGLPTQETTASFEVVAATTYGMAVTNIFSLQILPVHTAPFEENFDNNNGNWPDSWLQSNALQEVSWTIEQLHYYVHPESSHTPTNMAILHTAIKTNSVTWLITPRIDFGENARAGQLRFYHYMETYLGDTDELSVYYKTAMDGEWELLETYTSSINSWTERVIDLPAISRQVYIAFAGTARSGHGVCVDTVKVWDPTPPYGFVTSSLLPNAIIDEPYETTLQAEGGYEPYSFTVVSNALPSGITLALNGVISGTASAVERAQVGIQVMDASGQIRVETYSLAVTEPVLNLFEENFEHGGEMPYDWTQEFDEFTTLWAAEMGGGYIGNPIEAYEGGFNARFFGYGEDQGDGTYEAHVTRLVSPKINLGQAPESVTLYFWQHMEEYEGDLDGLRVLYRTSSDGEWIELAKFSENTPEWTERSMILPDPTADYYIAFEGTARFGYGLCIDDIRITDESLAPVITTERQLPDGVIDFEYEVQLAALGGLQTYSWSLAEGTLPNGVSLSADGRLSGTPLEVRTNDFHVCVTGFDGQSSTNGFSLKIRSVPTVPFFEDFEENGAMPRGWSQEIVNGVVNWTIATGTACPSSTRIPTSAHSGTYNVSLFSNSKSIPAMTKLITPMLDLGGGVTNAVLKFQHYMKDWLGDQDWLKIYSKTNLNGEWELLREYKDDTPAGNSPDWTERAIALTNVSSTFYIAFESYAKYGYGICVDDVSIDGEVPELPYPYGDWLGNYFSPLDIGSGVDTGYYADPDGDGIYNIWEYAHLLDPGQYNYSGTPTGGVEEARLKLIYRQNKDATDLTFIVEACTDLVLGDWSTNGVSEFIRIDNGGWWEVGAEHDVSVTNAPSRFMRLKLLEN